MAGCGRRSPNLLRHADRHACDHRGRHSADPYRLCRVPVEGRGHRKRLASGRSYAFWLLVIAACMTSFYSWRLMFLTFYGKPRGDHHAHDRA